jgi:hypothetical protein
MIVHRGTDIKNFGAIVTDVKNIFAILKALSQTV